MIHQNDSQQGKDLVCGSCGSARISTTVQSDEFSFGDGPDAPILEVAIPVHHCESCGSEFTGADTEDLRHEAVCRHLGVMTPTEIRSLRERRGLSRVDFAKLTRIGEATIARWERGALIQNAGYDQLLRLLLFDDNISRLRQPTQDTPGVNPIQMALFRCLTVNDARRREQAAFTLRKTA